MSNIFFTYQLLSGNFDRREDYITCLKMLKLEINERRLDCIFKIEDEAANKKVNIHIMYAQDVPEFELKKVLEHWNMLLKGLGLPVQDSLITRKIDSGIETSVE